MNCDVTYCIDFDTDCPFTCIRAKQTAELWATDDRPKYYTSWAEFECTAECPKFDKWAAENSENPKREVI